MAVSQLFVFAQQIVNGYPINLSQYSQQISFQCPAATVVYNEWESTVTSRRNLGFWRNNQTYYAQGAFRIQKDPKANFHGLGVAMYYDKEGAYLKRSRGYLLYAYHIKLNNNYSLSGGISLGLMSYQAGNVDYDGGTENALDANLGFMFYSNRFFVAANIAQLPQSKLQPINEITVLTRYYQFLVGKDFPINENILLKTNINSKIYSSQTPDIYCQAGLKWNETLGLYGTYKLQRHAAIMFGIEKIELDGFQLRSYISYDIPFNGDPRYQAFEITLQCLKPGKTAKNKSVSKKKRKR